MNLPHPDHRPHRLTLLILLPLFLFIAFITAGPLLAAPPEPAGISAGGPLDVHAAHSGQDAQLDRRLVTGRVFHDLNGNGVKDRNEPGIGGVLVSNGETVVSTDKEGGYRLELEINSHLFVIKPRNWETPTDPNGIPRFYFAWSPEGVAGEQYKGLPPTGPLPKSIDFPLYRVSEPDRFRVLVFGDTQPRDIEEIHYFAHDTVQEVAGTDALFGITLGDLVFDDLDLLQPLNEVVGLIGIPWRHVIGNHDLDYTASTPQDARGAYYHNYGPSTYAFTVGRTHFIAVDNIRYITSGEGNRYRTGVNEKQLSFIENLLHQIPEEDLVVFLTHIPWVYSTGWENETERKRLFNLIAPRRNTVSFSAHTHRHFHRFLGPEEGWPGEQTHHMISMGTTCGAWWSGAPDEYGIPHAMMRDGTPTGYAFLDIDGSDWKLTYKASRRPSDFQMHIHAPDAVDSSQSVETEVAVNIFNALPDAIVEMRIGKSGNWHPLRRTEARDPFYLTMHERERGLGEVPWRLPGTGNAVMHHWSGILPDQLEPGAHLLQIRARDRWHHYTGQRVIRITQPKLNREPDPELEKDPAIQSRMRLSTEQLVEGHLPEGHPL